MNLYCWIPFGRQHSHAPEIIELAGVLGRTPSSVAMKLNNLTSLDPEEQLRGVRGLTGASLLDRQVWNEFHENWERLAAESEGLWHEKVAGLNATHSSSESGQTAHQQPFDSNLPEVSNHSDRITEGERRVRVRLAQDFFRRTVLIAYHHRCCVSGIPLPEFLIASHILPWSRFPAERINPRNGLCLSRLHDAAFDRGLMTFDEKNHLVLSACLKDYLPNDSLNKNFLAYEGRLMELPERFAPDPGFLEHHRQQIFQG
ncbi:MAG: HNH endonuclease [Blastocatellia bacterium]|nr:HNH endonuclease [Blastocatellia bacterium]